MAVEGQHRARLPPMPPMPERPRALKGTQEHLGPPKPKMTEAQARHIRARAKAVSATAAALGHRQPIDDGCHAVLSVMLGFAKHGNYSPSHTEIAMLLWGKAKRRTVERRMARLERYDIVRIQPVWLPSAEGNPTRQAHLYSYNLDEFEDAGAVAAASIPEHPQPVESGEKTPPCDACPLMRQVSPDFYGSGRPSVLSKGTALRAAPAPVVERMREPPRPPPGLDRPLPRWVVDPLGIEASIEALERAARDKVRPGLAALLRKVQDLERLIWTAMESIDSTGPGLTWEAMKAALRWDDDAATQGRNRQVMEWERPGGLEQDAAQAAKEVAEADEREVQEAVERAKRMANWRQLRRDTEQARRAAWKRDEKFLPRRLRPGAPPKAPPRRS